jgi:predicted transcriptional regulator
LEFLKVIKRVAGKIAPGRVPSFNEAQVAKALEVINSCGIVGRMRLSRKLELGEGIVRTFLRHATKERIVECSRHGIVLSECGRRLFSDLRAEISEGIEVPSSPLTVGPFNIAILVRNVAREVRTGVEERDIAFKAGALGATTLVFSRNKLIMPTDKKEAFKGTPSIHNMLVSKLNPKENDAIIIGSGKNRKLAEQGATMAALELLNQKAKSLAKMPE